MSVNLTPEQSDVLKAQGRVIVSASAGSGKTFVMIEKLVDLLESGVPVSDILAVTFTNKAAEQMKEKLRKKLIERLATVDEKKRRLLKAQLSEISSANISTIHSLCVKLLRTYFYCLDFDGSFDILTDDDPVTVDLKMRALDEVMERGYEENTEEFRLLLSCLRKKRSDENIRALLLSSYKEVRNIVGYREKLNKAQENYTDDGFHKVCADYHEEISMRAKLLRESVENFQKDFFVKNKAAYEKRFEEMYFALDQAIANPDIFAPHPALCGTKPHDKEEDKAEGDRYSAFVNDLKKKYASLFDGIGKGEEEQKNYLSSGQLVIAYSHLLLAFDEAYTALKREEGKLDLNDLEHYTLDLLKNESVLHEVRSKYRYVYVDEYQDVNPIQETILSAIGGENMFLVGDVKQAIYGFRGSKSYFFAHKFDLWDKGEGAALKLSSNFRSSDGVVNFVNDLFSRAMREETCGIDYAKNSLMVRGAAYPEGSGSATFHVFGKEEAKETAEGVYSVAEHAEEKPLPSREGLAIVSVIQNCLKRTYYDLNEKCQKPITYGDICILTRKKNNESIVGIVRALEQAGIPVTGSGADDILQTPEVKTILDILSYIDNAEQDIPLVSAMLSPLGDFSEDELAQIRLAFPSDKANVIPYRLSCERYAVQKGDELSIKLRAFFAKMNDYRDLSELFGAASLIAKILSDTSLEARWERGDGKKLQNVRRLSAYARTASGELSVGEFLAEIRALKNIPATDSSTADSVKMMTMHASKGLEFPVVILSDICRTFRGMDYEEMPFDEELGFTPKYYDLEKHLRHDTLLRRLSKMRQDREDLKNELNLYYVACTRAMFELHVMAEEVKEYSLFSSLSAKCYADFTDISRYHPQYVSTNEQDEQQFDDVVLVGRPDENLLEAINAHFQRPYTYRRSIDLPVKSSASAILRMQEQEVGNAKVLFKEEREKSFSGTDVGTAYHRFLELCDLSVSDEKAITAQRLQMEKDGLLSPEQSNILSDKKLVEILSMPIFRKVKGAQIYREQEFLCRIPARDFLPTPAEDVVLVQGAIDLLILSKDGCHIVDYKYSARTDEGLREAYAGQLALYKKAVSIILKIDEKTIKTTIVNIRLNREIVLD